MLTASFNGSEVWIYDFPAQKRNWVFRLLEGLLFDVLKMGSCGWFFVSRTRDSHIFGGARFCLFPRP